MKIIHISNSNGRGGAAIATIRLNKALLNEQHDSSIWVNYKYGENQNIKTASYFWVGSEAPIKGTYPNKWKNYET